MSELFYPDVRRARGHTALIGRPGRLEGLLEPAGPPQGGGLLELVSGPHHRRGPASDGIRDLLVDALDVVGVEGRAGGEDTAERRTALERGAAFCRVLATGAAFDADYVEGVDEEVADAITRRASSMVRTADEREQAAALWRPARARQRSAPSMRPGG